ncbi:hypothetical protein KKF61_02360 [Patescibacteria group bacterium]|nr:hypothetical protein [Patescibacteria group bacterium]MBU0964058.1 hypothetical protein [Patescibacteria group bacterium]
MAKLLTGKKKLKSLPKEKPKLLLPKPQVNIVPAALLILIPIVLLVVYIFFPWFALSDTAVSIIILIITLIFIIGLLTLMYMMVKFMLDISKDRQEAIKRDKKVLAVILLFLLSVAFISATAYLIQPQAVT